MLSFMLNTYSIIIDVLLWLNIVMEIIKFSLLVWICVDNDPMMSSVSRASHQSLAPRLWFHLDNSVWCVQSIEWLRVFKETKWLYNNLSTYYMIRRRINYNHKQMSTLCWWKRWRHFIPFNSKSKEKVNNSFNERSIAISTFLY